MAENNSSAEHELLRAIEGKGNLTPRARAGGGEAKDNIILALETWKKKLSQIDLKASLNLADINRVMLVLAALLVLFQAGVLIKGIFRMSNIPTFDASSALKPTGIAREIKFPMEEYSNYIDAFMGRNIFLERQAAVVSAEQPKAAEIEDISKKFRLTGISWLEESGEKFAIIEDLEVKVTHYLQEQETLRGFMIDKIDRTRVILKKDGREIELR